MWEVWSRPWPHLSDCQVEALSLVMCKCSLGQESGLDLHIWALSPNRHSKPWKG